MANYLRNYAPGGTFFFTLVTHQRRRILTTPSSRRLLRAAFRRVRHRWPFDVIAIVLCPDHLHTVWSLPDGDFDYSRRISLIKETFTKAYLAAGGREGYVSHSRTAHRERGMWQRRFWEHTYRGQNDLKRCVDYIHWNPIKHALAERVADYPWSSFHRYLGLGEYPTDWGGENPCPGLELGE